MAKSTPRKTSRKAAKSAAGTRKKAARKPTGRTAPPKARKKKEENVTALITQGADVGQLVPHRKRDDLTKWFNAYLAVEVDPDSNTFRAKVQDIQRFLRFFHDTTDAYRCDDWTRAVSKRFIKWLGRQKARDQQGRETDRLLSAATQIRVLDTLKHASRWIHRHRPFLTGLPFGKGDGIETKRPGWKGLTDLQVTRLLSAAEQLIHTSTKKNQDPVRDYAILRVLLHSALRVNEFVGLQLSQYKGKHLVNIPRKGGVVTAKIFLDQPAREAIDAYIEKSRGRKAGPFFLSKNGKRLTQQAVYDILQRIAAHANSKLSADKHIEIHPHLLRHTQLRKVAREKGIEAAMELSGHKSERYIWRYIQASEDEMEEALTDLWD